MTHSHDMGPHAALLDDDGYRLVADAIAEARPIITAPIRIDFEAFARNYAQALYKAAVRGSADADMAYSFNHSDHNAYACTVWNRWAVACDNLRDEVEDLIYDALRARALKGLAA